MLSSLKTSSFLFFLLFTNSQSLRKKSSKINFAVINKSPGVVNCWYQCGKRKEDKLSLLQEMHGELTAATLKSLTRVLCHEDYKVLRRHSRQVLVESCTDGLHSVFVSLFCAPFSSFLFSLLLSYCFSFPATASRSPKHKWRLMPKRPTLPQETPFRPLIFFSSFANWFTYHEYCRGSFLYEVNSMQMSGQKNSEPIGRSCCMGIDIEHVDRLFSLLASAGFRSWNAWNLCNEGLTNEWLVCYQDYLIRRDVA